ncbi:DUF354 domain-containing protein [Litoribacter alkaliphilus]|uniref:DUF354 domain-containing protein n=1 Tax=Litoribacter ruber TaxID=702568 RepID=A0AAP2CJH0_9BACT|nr:DUF354 domain-containing protein [Litoribacter alkaliphilus]
MDIGHPAHVHYFKNVILILKSEGFEFLIIARNKDVSFSLLDNLKMDYFSRGKGRNSFFGKILYIMYADLIIYKKAIKFNPDLYLSFASPYAAHVSKFTGKPHIAFDDTENAKLAHKFYRPFTKKIFSPSSYKGKLHHNQKLFNGLMELSYLHPKYFQPDESIKDFLGIKEGERYIILRFVSWKASHDIGHKGLTLDHKIKCTNEFSKYGKVFITSEDFLPPQLEKYRINIPPHKMHDVLAFSSLLYGESSTMSSECAVLGVPSIYHDNVGRGYTTELEDNYGLVYNFTESEEDQERGLNKGIEILKRNNPLSFVQKKQQLIKDKIDVTSFIINKIKEELY